MPKTSSSLTADWPPADVLLGAWRRLVEDPDAAAEFAALVLPPLVAGLADRNRGTHPDDVATAAGDAVLAFLKRPGAYDPDRLPLANYLSFIAKRRLQNQWTAERRHHAGRIPWDSVELDLPARNEGAEDDDSPSFDTPELQAVIAGLTVAERAVFDLLRTDERRTAAFAEALGIAGLPVPEQEAEVKRAKDRIKARLKRAAGGDHD